MRQTFLATGWEFRANQWDKVIGTVRADWMPAMVPGHVHNDLVNNGVIADPHTLMNEIGAQWVDTTDWTYRTTFAWTADPTKPRQLLRFEGLDTVCEISLNGAKVGESDNMFVPLDIDVTGKLQEGSNDLVIEFRSAVNVGNERRAAHHAKYNVGDVDRFDDRSFVRKAQYMFGWDWGPRLVSCGIWQPVSLFEYSTMIVDVEVGYTWNADGSANLTLKTITDGGSGSAMHDVYVGDLAIEDLLDGTHVIESPPLWSPDDPICGYVITSFDDVAVRTDLGFSNIKLLREPDQFGESFEFEVNGNRVWAMGANWIPDHSFPSQVTEQRLHDRLAKAKSMGINMLRVWGGGLYESDAFYNLCDAYGIMVWQDFLFGCAYYPDDEAWQAVIRREAEVNVKRIRKHPSLCLWCGNNENLEMFINQWGGPDRTPKRYFGENHYDVVLPAVVQELDPRTSYIASSPIGTPPAEKVVDAKRRGPNADHYGDQHNWDVWHGRGDWRNYTDSKGRFSSEYGFASSCSMHTWRKAAGLSGQENVRDQVVVWHDKTTKGTETFIGFVELHYPKQGSLEDWVYYSQLNQRDALRHGVEHYRRSEFCKGSLIWQINDCWPVQSWSFMDSEGRLKALGYELSRLHDPLLISLVRDSENVHVWAINDGETVEEHQLVVRALHLTDGRVLREASMEFSVAPGERKAIGSFNVAGLAVPDVLLTAGFAAWQLLAEPKNARLGEPLPIIVSTASAGELVIKTAQPVVDLMLTVDGDPLPFEENFLTLAEPGLYIVPLTESVSRLEARSLAGKHKVIFTTSPI